MRTQIRHLIDPIYTDPPLQDHPNVLNLPSVRGMADNLFFLTHNENETHVADTGSKYNDHEALMAAKLAVYLLMQEIDVTKITILTMYSGQKRKIYERLRDENKRVMQDMTDIRVSSVDGFQGEESDVIILSLVRSNDQGNIGFLSVANRVCVALSRAKLVI